LKKTGSFLAWHMSEISIVDLTETWKKKLPLEELLEWLNKVETFTNRPSNLCQAT
jgi:hypothetical protein